MPDHAPGSRPESRPEQGPEQSALPGLPATFRPTRTRAVLLTVGAVAAAVLTAISMLLPATGRTGWGAGDRATLVGAGLLIFAVLALLSRPKVIADRAGVTVVNLTRKRRLEWAEIVRVNLRPGDPWVYLDLADGTSLPAMGIQPGIGRQQAIRDARALRALADTHGTGRPGA